MSSVQDHQVTEKKVTTQRKLSYDFFLHTGGEPWVKPKQKRLQSIGAMIDKTSSEKDSHIRLEKCLDTSPLEGF